MFHAPPPAEAAAMQRAEGVVRIAVKLRAGQTVLDRLHQSGCGKARMPRADGFEAVLLNTAGGLTGGDRMAVEIAAPAGCRVTAASQTAERIYRTLGGAARVLNRLTIGPGARIDWLPQETILFDGGALERRLIVEMAPDATLLAVEPLILGRAAMGERVRSGALADIWRVRRGGRLLHADALRF
ncbi:MAG: urease accessory protein UreD, partial [Paracoccaceae bacterium]